MQIFPSLLYSPSRKSMLGMAVTLWVMMQDDDKIAVLMRMTDVMCVCPARLVLVESPAPSSIVDSFHQHSVFESHCYQQQNECPPSTLSCLSYETMIQRCVMLHRSVLGAYLYSYLMCCCVSIFPFLPKLVPFLPKLVPFLSKLVPGWYLMHAHLCSWWFIFIV